MFTRSKLFLFKVYFEFVTLNDSQPSFILRLFRRTLSPSLHPGPLPDQLRQLLRCKDWQGLFGASLIHRYPAVCGCGIDVLFVSRRQLLKYIIYEILHRKERLGRKAMAVESFTIFAPFAVDQTIKPSPFLFFGFPAATSAWTPMQCWTPSILTNKDSKNQNNTKTDTRSNKITPAQLFANIKTNINST
jgi:hypothetical protein